MVTYLSYFRNLPRVYLLDIETGTQEVVGDFPGMTLRLDFLLMEKDYNEFYRWKFRHLYYDLENELLIK